MVTRLHTLLLFMAAILARVELVNAIMSQDVMDLHLWGLTPGIPLLTAHLLVYNEAEASDVLKRATQYCQSIGIEHITIQVDCNFCHDR